MGSNMETSMAVPDHRSISSPVTRKRGVVRVIASDILKVVSWTPFVLLDIALLPINLFIFIDNVSGYRNDWNDRFLASDLLRSALIRWGQSVRERANQPLE